jgi:hypothetical protein
MDDHVHPLHPQHFLDDRKRQLRQIKRIGSEDTVIGGRALSGRTASFTQQLEIVKPKSGGVKIEAFVSDIGGNMTTMRATA